MASPEATRLLRSERRALGLRKRDRIRDSFRANGEVVLQRVSPDPIEEDPALAPYRHQAHFWQQDRCLPGVPVHTGQRPDDWDELLLESAQAPGRLQQLTGRLPGTEG